MSLLKKIFTAVKDHYNSHYNLIEEPIISDHIDPIKVEDQIFPQSLFKTKEDIMKSENAQRMLSNGIPEDMVKKALRQKDIR